MITVHNKKWKGRSRSYFIHLHGLSECTAAFECLSVENVFLSPIMLKLQQLPPGAYCLMHL